MIVQRSNVETEAVFFYPNRDCTTKCVNDSVWLSNLTPFTDNLGQSLLIRNLQYP